ncbi:hypothetical protein CWI39_1980p0010 [Hamiltosporidium magnivora]|uniref:Serine aminopeptidase S33 domain-containing protein n=1 Tax=Hamiltosporidium magnivora TaxID=148818 RepID=A0A4V2JUB6_9MICR|nr:hypothetical protein CWI39_1980p0010 [Hamiltosporidium magnivora]
MSIDKSNKEKRKKSFLTKFIKNRICCNSQTSLDNFDESIFRSDKIFKNIYLQTKDSTIIGAWLISPIEINQNTKYAVLLHGNASNRRTFCENFEIENFIEMNYCVIVPDYREFGDSKGVFTVEGVIYDLERCIEYMYKTYNTDSVSIISYSLGTAVTLEFYKYFCTKYLESKENENNFYSIELPKIVLISPFSSTIKILQESRLWNFINKLFPKTENKIREEFNFNSIDNIKCVDKRNVIIFHGSEDVIVPFSHGLELSLRNGCKIYRCNGDDHISIMLNPNVWNNINLFLREENN